MKKITPKTTEKYVTEKTFETNMQAIAKSFHRVDKALEMHGRVMQDILKEVKSIHEDNKHFRNSIIGLNSDSISYERRVENLTFRVEKLESKNK